RYGVVTGQQVKDGVIKMTNIVEKPGKANAPSDLASVSSYLLPGEFFGYLERARDDFDGRGEFTVQPIMQEMIDDGFDFYGVEITNGTYYDTGDKLEYIKTVVDFGLKHQKLGPALRQFLQSRINGENR
ncbi:MAG: UTP--glucose-1-phosphate uridylyltransferase, partial [Candidatus Saccharimonas sp.]